ncbi:Golgi to ER traffic protein 4 homolog [Bacillus rossius redtenbacheri]|uniref:Golgi to ER traffic protein 4 homolog n=1 Tax=Bacillus rossius redtenbacheri TaxID=93214 RepID=UPI002FDDA6B3
MVVDYNMAATRVHGVPRILSKLQGSIRDKNFYEAHQLYRTLYFRYLGVKKYKDLLDLLYSGAILLLENDQHTSGADVAILYVDVLVKSETPPTDEYIVKLSRLLQMMDPDAPERETYLEHALRWSGDGGHPQLHKSLAQVFWKQKNYVRARQHFLQSCDGRGFAVMLVELQRQHGFTAEVDLFIAQAVLQYLCVENKWRTAKDAFQTYTLQHPNIRAGPPYLLPLLNFLWFLLKAVESGKLNAFKVLCEQYQPSIRRDPSYQDYLDKIGHVFFGIPLPKAHSQGFFENILQSFLTGVPEDTRPQPSTSRQHAHMDTDALD